MNGRRVRKPPNQKSVRAWVEQADRCRALGDYRRAERLYQKALVASERTFGRDAVEVAVLLNSLGVACKYSGRFREAGRHYWRALGIYARLPVSDPAALAALYHNLGGLEHARGRFAQGEPFARRSVALRERASGHVIRTSPPIWRPWRRSSTGRGSMTKPSASTAAPWRSSATVSVRRIMRSPSI